MVLVNINNGNNAETTVDQLTAMCKKDNVSLGIMPSRRGNYFIVKFNDCAVARLYNNAADAAFGA